jgi:alkanesulfonate monooxygenase SsuD/methylene tetrahydromethanopterin reductase-like flavin-dependent oxidoreductase (luciferase family)
VLDHLIDGRFLCGIGRGYQPYEMAGFGGNVAESRQRFRETLEVLLKAWTAEESFTYNGELVQIANPVTIFPKPLQRPYPPLLLMGTSVDSMQVAAQLDMLAFSSAMMGMEGVRAQFGALLHAHAALDKLLTNLRSISHRGRRASMHFGILMEFESPQGRSQAESFREGFDLWELDSWGQILRSG